MPTRKDGRDSSDGVLRPLRITDREYARRQRVAEQAVLRRVVGSRLSPQDAKTVLCALGLREDDDPALSGIGTSPELENAPEPLSEPELEGKPVRRCASGEHWLTDDNVYLRPAAEGKRRRGECIACKRRRRKRLALGPRFDDQEREFA